MNSIHPSQSALTPPQAGHGDVAETLAILLRATGWTQQELANRLAVSFATLNSWVNARSQPRKRALQRIADACLMYLPSNHIDETQWVAAKKTALTLKLSARTLLRSQQMLDALTLHVTYHTNTIEGSTMTLADVHDVLFEQRVLPNRSAIEQAETRNHQAAMLWAIAAAARHTPIDDEFITGIHVRLMTGIVSDAGQYRRHPVRIAGSHVPVANYARVPNRMHEFINNTQESSLDLIAQLARCHAEFEQIHPFSDGNGRTGRLIMLTQALLAGQVPPLLAKERKHVYYHCLRRAQLEAEYRPLEQLLAESIVTTDQLLQRDL